MKEWKQNEEHERIASYKDLEILKISGMNYKPLQRSEEHMFKPDTRENEAKFNSNNQQDELNISNK